MRQPPIWTNASSAASACAIARWARSRWVNARIPQTLTRSVAYEKTRSIPIIIVSAQELSHEEQERLTGQVEVLLRKGIFTENELLEDVSQALDRIQRDQKALA